MTEELFQRLDELAALPALERAACEGAIRATLDIASNANPYFLFYEATMSRGPFTSARLREPKPGAGATSTERQLDLELNPGVTYGDVTTHYGVGRIFEIIPEPMPEGLTTYVYERPAPPGAPARKLFFQCTARSLKLLSVTVRFAS